MGQFCILFVDGCGDARLLAAAELLATAIAERGVDGVQVLTRGLPARPAVPPADLAKLADWLASQGDADGRPYSGVAAPALLTPTELDSAELVFSFDDATRDDLLEMGAGRAYTVLDYLGRPPEPLPGPGVEAFETVAAWISQLVEQVLYELETDPARPGGVARE